ARVEEVLPALGLRQPLLGEELRVEAEAERAGVDADRAVLRLLGLARRPVVELAEPRRLVLQREPLLGRLQVWVPGAAPPDVALGVGRLGLDPGVELSGALPGHVDLDAGRLLEGGDHRPAPLLLGRAVEVELALGLGGAR